MKLNNILSICNNDTEEVLIHLGKNNITYIEVLSPYNLEVIVEEKILEKIYDDIDDRFKIENHTITIDIPTSKRNHIVRFLID